MLGSTPLLLTSLTIWGVIIYVATLWLVCEINIIKESFYKFLNNKNPIKERIANLCLFISIIFLIIIWLFTIFILLNTLY